MLKGYEEDRDWFDKLTAAEQHKCKEEQAFWKDQSMTRPPTGLRLFALTLLCNSHCLPHTLSALVAGSLSKAAVDQLQCPGSEAKLS